MQHGASDVHRLPLLERPWRVVVAESGSDMASLTPVLIVALDCPTNYWPSQALGWLEDGFPMNVAIAESLRGLHERRGITQRNRHRALHLVKAYLRSGARS